MIEKWLQSPKMVRVTLLPPPGSMGSTAETAAARPAAAATAAGVAGGRGATGAAPARDERAAARIAPSSSTAH
jgi:hypothetical protein